MSEPNLKILRDLMNAHIDEGMAVMKAFGGTMYLFDLLTYGVLNRSMSLTSGFILLIQEKNYVAATTLVRPQLDTFLRYAAGWLVANPHEFANNVLKGIHITKLKTSDGHNMTDRYLVDHFKKDLPWIARVYEETSGFIHLSSKHMLMNVTGTSLKDMTIDLSITDKHEHVPPEILEEAISGFAEITKLILHRVYSWRLTKENPPTGQQP